MTDEGLEAAVSEHYQVRTLNPAVRQALVDQARRGRQAWWPPVLVVAAVAAVLCFAIVSIVPEEQVAPTPGQEEEGEAAPPERVYVELTTDSGEAYFDCGEDRMMFTQRLDLSLGADELPRTCTVEIAGVTADLEITGSGYAHCDLHGEKVVCTGP